MKLASRFKRVLAYLVDIGFLALLFLLIGFIVPLKNSGREWIMVSLIVTIYFSLYESSQHQATLGKMLFGIYISQVDGRPVDFSIAFNRYMLFYLPSLGSIISLPLAITLNIIMLVPILFKERQALYEKWSNTITLSR